MNSAHARAAALSTLLLLCVTFHAAAAQRTGDRIRVVMAGDTLTGDIMERRETGFTMTLWVGPDRAERDVEYAQVDQLEVRTCCTDYAWLWSSLGGGLVGMAVGAATNEEVCAEYNVVFLFEGLDCETVGNNHLVGGLIGGAVGLVVGMTALSDRWEIIRPRDPSGPSVTPLAGIRPAHGGTAMLLGARIRWRCFSC